MIAKCKVRLDKNEKMNRDAILLGFVTVGELNSEVLAIVVCLDGPHHPRKIPMLDVDVDMRHLLDVV